MANVGQDASIVAVKGRRLGAFGGGHAGRGIGAWQNAFEGILVHHYRIASSGEISRTVAWEDDCRRRPRRFAKRTPGDDIEVVRNRCEMKIAV
jgi:hypothetical protein